MDMEKQEQAQTPAPQAPQTRQPRKDKAGAGRNPFAKLPVKPQVLGIAAAVILVIIAAAALLRTTDREKPQPQVLNTSTLEKIINVSELSTFTAVYNGIAEVANEKKPEQTAVCELAKQNAENVLKALAQPIVNQLGKGYRLVIE